MMTAQLIHELLKQGERLARNPHMQNMMRMIGFGENLGTGFPAIVSTWEQAYHIRPVLSEHPSIFATELLLPTRVATTTESTNVTENHTETIQKSRGETTQTTTQTTTQKIIELMRQNREISIDEIAKKCGITRGGVNYQIKRMKQKNLIRRIGFDNGGHWEIIE